MISNKNLESLINKIVENNEKQYGAEIRGKHGNDTIDRSNVKVKNMTKEQYKIVNALSEELNYTLKAAFEQGDPSDELAQKACKLHKEWLCAFWDNYSKEAHIGVTQMYVDDPRFTKYYDNVAVGSAKFLQDAVAIFCK